MVYDSGYKTCMCYITNHFETTIIDINIQKQTFSKFYVFIHDKVGWYQYQFGDSYPPFSRFQNVVHAK